MKEIISAILPVRNRPGARVIAAGKSLLESRLEGSIELIISDYGSKNHAELRLAAQRLGAKYRRVEANYWNKPECLNSAIEIAVGERILCADIDVLWHPDALQFGLKSVQRGGPDTVLAFQTRDLPSNLTEPLLTGVQVPNWEDLEFHSKLHSTWGNGILLFPRDGWSRVGGYDERLSVYGVEDLDFCRRLQSDGAAFLWSDPKKSKLFHVWHPRLSDVSESASFGRALERNKKIWRKDFSVVRNALTRTDASAEPLVSVIIATAGRSEYLREALSSLLCQTVQDFEIIIIDDGQFDDTEEVVRSFNDNRIRYYGFSSQRGISAARNFGGDQSQGRFVMVMDDDDIAVPNRMEVSLASITPGVDGCVGGFITFDDANGAVTSWNDPLPTLNGAIEKGGFAGHMTWMVRRSVFNSFPYDESFTSAVDNNKAMRMLRSGVNLVHTGKVHVLRRVHSGQVSNQDQQFQGFGATINRSWLWAGLPPAKLGELRAKSAKEAPDNRAKLYEAEYVPYFPDSLIRRSIDVVAFSKEQRNVAQHFDGLMSVLELFNDVGEFVFGKYRVDGSWVSMARAAQAGLRGSIVGFTPTSKLTARPYVADNPEFAWVVPWDQVKSENDGISWGDGVWRMHCRELVGDSWVEWEKAVEFKGDDISISSSATEPTMYFHSTIVKEEK